jgi:hypothetical protein
VADAKSLGDFVDGDHGRVSSAGLKRTDILLAQAREIGQILLAQALLEPDPPDVPADQRAHIHVREVNRLHTKSLSPIRCGPDGVRMDTIPQDDAAADEAPWSGDVTAYDKAHLKIYMRLLDAKAQGAHPDEVCRVLFEIDPVKEPDRARIAYETHQRRAQWFAEIGYRKLLTEQ